MKRAALLALAFAVAAPAGAADKDPAAAEAAALLRGTVGIWDGELTYSDYQTGERTALKVTRTVSMLPDEATLQSIAAYDDGPSGIVYIVSLEALDAEAATWQSATFRKGDAMETATAELALPTPPKDDRHWTVVTLEDGIDGDSPATIRETITRDGDRLTTLTEYDRKNDGKDAYAFRNEEVLTRRP